MKMISLLTVLVGLTIASAHATDQKQTIECKFSNSNSKDHVNVTLNDPQSGTFYYSSNIEDSDDNQHTGLIGLNRVADPIKDSSIAQFLAKWTTIQDGSYVTIEFHFSMPKELLMKSSKSFKAILATSIIDEAITPQAKNAKPTAISASDDIQCSAKI